jgi:hypothetical protein
LTKKKKKMMIKTKTTRERSVDTVTSMKNESIIVSVAGCFLASDCEYSFCVCLLCASMRNESFWKGAQEPTGTNISTEGPFCTGAFACVCLHTSLSVCVAVGGAACCCSALAGSHTCSLAGAFVGNPS